MCYYLIEREVFLNFNNNAGSEGPRFSDRDLRFRAPGVRALRLDGLDEVHALEDLPEDDVLVVEPGGHDRRDEELHIGRVERKAIVDRGADDEVEDRR